MKKIIFFILVAFLQLPLHGQSFLSNGNFENHQGTISTLVDWSANSFAGLSFSPTGTSVGLTDNDNDVFPNSDGRILQEVQMYEGAHFDLSFTLVSGVMPSNWNAEYSHVMVIAENSSNSDTEVILDMSVEDIAGLGPVFISEDFTADHDFDRLVITVDGFDYNDSPNDDGFRTWGIGVDNVSLTSPDGPNFHFVDNIGISTTEFCISEDVFMDATASESVDKYYIDAWRRPLSSGSNIPFVWAGFLDWNEDNEIGVLNLSALFNNAGYPFEGGYEYQIKLAINNDYSGWWSETHEFTLINEIEHEFHLENENEEETNLFCDGGDIFLNGVATENEDFFQIFIYERDLATNNSFEYLVTLSGGPSGQVGVHNLTNWIGNYSKEFKNNHEYKIKLRVGNLCDSSVDAEKIIEVNLPPVPEFHFVDSDQNITTQFCTAEEVILDGTASQYEDKYRISIYERLMGATTGFSWRGATSWIPGGVGELVLDDIYEDFGYQFLGGYEYKVKLTVSNVCDGWESKTKVFQMFEDCCFAPQNLSCSRHSGSAYLNWDPVPMAVSYTVQITYNACCQSTLPQFSTQFNVKKELSLQAPNAIYDCFSWVVIAHCGHNTYYSEEACFTTKEDCSFAEAQGDDSRYRIDANIDFKVFPNPASGYINISFEGDIENGEMLLIDPAGRIVMQTNTIVSQIDAESFEPGIYFLLIKSAENILYRERVVIVK